MAAAMRSSAASTCCGVARQSASALARLISFMSTVISVSFKFANGKNGQPGGPEQLRTPEFGKIDDGGSLGDGAAEALDQAGAGHHRAAGGDQVVDEQYAVTGLDGVGVDL